MLRRKTVLGLVALSLIGLYLTSPSYSQQEQRGQRGQRGGQQGQRGQRGQDQGQGQQGRGGQRGQDQDQGQNQQGRGGQRSEQRQSDTERMQERLGATDQEWTVLGPRVMKVSELIQQLRSSSRANRGGRQRGGSQNDRSDSRQTTTASDQSTLEKLQEQLRTLLNEPSATPDQINKQLAALRAAKAKAMQQLVVAQAYLRKVITVRQEAQLVMMGMLD